MTSINDWALRFVRWGLGLTLVGLVTGYFPLIHYLMKDSLPSCPTAPVHGHTILLSFVGMPMFGLLYRALPSWMNGMSVPLGLVRAHFWLAVAGIIGVSVNGTIVYEVLQHAQDEFYYVGSDGQFIRNLWFGIDGAFLTLYGIGSAILLYVFTTRTEYADAAQPVSRKVEGTI